jgi:hypothetical protein
MPEELWAAAVAVAREHGVWFVSRTLRLNYASLRQRLGPPPGDGVAGFVEVPPGALVGAMAPAATAVVELWSKDGARMTVRVEGRGPLDVPALVEAFWRKER